VIACTVHTNILIDNVNTVTGGDCADRAFRLAGSTVGAFLGDTVCHGFKVKWIVEGFQ
jgi:hypothetical protein